MRFDIIGFTCSNCGCKQREDIACPRCGTFDNWTDDVGVHESKAEILEDLKEGLELWKTGDPLAHRYFLAMHRTYGLVTSRQRAILFDHNVRRALTRVGMPLEAKPKTSSKRKRAKK
jgi:hypothetical protein